LFDLVLEPAVLCSAELSSSTNYLLSYIHVCTLECLALAVQGAPGEKDTLKYQGTVGAASWQIVDEVLVG